MKKEKEHKKRRWPIFVALVLEGIFCLFWLSSRQEDFRYGIGYEISPLEMKQISVINRFGDRALFFFFLGKMLYEVRIVYENPSRVTGDFTSGPDFTTEEGYYPYEVQRVWGEDLSYETRYTQKIPAGHTGTFSWFLAMDPQVGTIRIKERASRLFGKKESVMLFLPENDGEVSEWTAGEA